MPNQLLNFHDGINCLIQEQFSTRISRLIITSFHSGAFGDTKLQSCPPHYYLSMSFSKKNCYLWRKDVSLFISIVKFIRTKGVPFLLLEVIFLQCKCTVMVGWWEKLHLIAIIGPRKKISSLFQHSGCLLTHFLIGQHLWFGRCQSLLHLVTLISNSLKILAHLGVVLDISVPFMDKV